MRDYSFILSKMVGEFYGYYSFNEISSKDASSHFGQSGILSHNITRTAQAFLSAYVIVSPCCTASALFKY